MLTFGILSNSCAEFLNKRKDAPKRKISRKTLSVLLSICLAFLMTPFLAFGIEEQCNNAQQLVNGQESSVQRAENQNTDAQAADCEGAEEQNASMQIADLHRIATQEPVAYEVPTFKDAKHPEKGLNWKTMYCTDYTVLTSSMHDLANQTVVVSGNLTMTTITISGGSVTAKGGAEQ